MLQRNRVTFTGIVCLALAATLPSLYAAPKAPSEQAEKEVLQDLHARALAVRDDAETLKTYIEAVSHFPADSHARVLQTLRNDVNRMGKDLVILDSDLVTLPAWEKDAFHSILPVSQDTASATREAIDYFNANKTHPWGPEDLAFATRISADAHRIADTAGNYLKYQKLRHEERQIRMEIGHTNFVGPQPAPGE